MKNIISFILVASLSVSTILFNISTSYGLESISSVGTYTDIKSTNWAYEAVKAMSDKSIVNGYSDGSFKPNDVVTYGEFIKMALIAASGEDAGNASSGNWATNYYNNAVELKYFTENDIPIEYLNNPITRAHMALIISSILGNYSMENDDKLVNSFTDINSQGENQILKAYSAGILTGYGDSTFRPDKTLTRAEAATVIFRLVDESKRVYPTVGGIAEEQKPLAEVITNSDCGIYINDGFYGAKSLNFPVGTELYDGRKYLIKDNKIVKCLSFSSRKGETAYASITGIDITSMDYIGSLNVDTYKMTIVTNPFMKKN